MRMKSRRWAGGGAALVAAAAVIAGSSLQESSIQPSLTAATTFIQSSGSSTSGTTLNLTYTSSVHSGDLLVGQFRTAAGTSVSDNLNGKWLEAKASSDGVNSLWYLPNAKAGTTTITVRATTSGPIRAITADYAGVATSGPLDSTACNTSTSSTATTGATVPVAAGDIVFAALGAWTSPLTVSAGSSDGVAATLRRQFSGSNGTSAEEDVLSSAAGVQNVSFRLNVSTSYGACVAVFHPKPTPTPSPAPTPTPTATTTPTASGGNGTLTFDGTFSPTDPASGPHWNSSYGTCHTYLNSQELSMTPLSTCSPVPDHLRTDICSSSGCSPTASNGQLYRKGTASCTTIPFYLPKEIPAASGNSWYQIAEMKDYTSVGADWGIGIADGGVSRLTISADTPGNQWNSVYHSSGPVTAGIWHTASVCTNNNDTIDSIWFDGQRLTGNAGSCNGQQTCTGLNLFYDGFTTQPLDINAYTGNTSGTDPWGGYTVIHGDPLIATVGSNGLPPEPAGGWNSP